MRYPDGHKETVRARIVAAASRALRRDGTAGVSIPRLMKQAGLTHGGFYGHFRDRDELVAEAIRFAAAQTGSQIFADHASGPQALLDSYLSQGHLKHPADGCVLAALGTEASRQPASVRRTFAAVARSFLRSIERKLHPTSQPGTLSDDTLALAARMIGALVLGRMVKDDALACRILAAARDLPSRSRAR